MSDQDFTKTVIRCCYCRKAIMLMHDGAWYHKHNASVSCRLGWTSNKATPGGAS